MSGNGNDDEEGRKKKNRQNIHHDVCKRIDLFIGEKEGRSNC